MGLIKTMIQRMMHKAIGYDKEEADRRKAIAEETVKDSMEARQRALEALGRSGWRQPGPLSERE